MTRHARHRRRQTRPHAGRGMTGVSNAAEFIDPALLPAEPVRIAAFDGENADPARGRALDSGVLAFTS